MEKIPAYRLHKPSGQAVVTIEGRDFYCGKHGTKESHKLYWARVNWWLDLKKKIDAEAVREAIRQASQKRKSVANRDNSDITLADAAKLYCDYSKGYYSKGEHSCNELMLRVVLRCYLAETVASIGPRELKVIRAAMIEKNWSRKYVNSQIGRLKRWFKWLAADGYIPAETYNNLAVVSGLRRGKSNARETKPIRPVSDEIVEATIAELGSVVADMVRLQLQTGMRPAELCLVRPCDIERSGDVWVYTPQKHKTEHYGRSREICIGERGQQILRPYLLRAEDAYCFSPKESADKCRAERSRSRKTPLACGNVPGSNRVEKPQRPPGEQFDVASYRQAIHRACDRAFPAPDGENVAAWRDAHRWNPNQLRHAFATKVRKQFGLEEAQVALGHSKADVTQIYAERNLELARQVAQRIG